MLRSGAQIEVPAQEAGTKSKALLFAIPSSARTRHEIEDYVLAEGRLVQMPRGPLSAEERAALKAFFVWAGERTRLSGSGGPMADRLDYRTPWVALLLKEFPATEYGFGQWYMALDWTEYILSHNLSKAQARRWSQLERTWWSIAARHATASPDRFLMPPGASRPEMDAGRYLDFYAIPQDRRLSQRSAKRLLALLRRIDSVEHTKGRPGARLWSRSQLMQSIVRTYPSVRPLALTEHFAWVKDILAAISGRGPATAPGGSPPTTSGGDERRQQGP